MDGPTPKSMQSLQTGAKVFKKEKKREMWAGWVKRGLDLEGVRS